MGTTANHDFPYPEPTDRARNGSVAIRALAEAVDATLAWGAGAEFPRAESPAAVGASAVVEWGAAAALVDFTYSAGVLTYTGPFRLFIVDAEVSLDHGGSAAVASAVEVRRNGVVLAGSYDSIQMSGSEVFTRSLVHHVSTPVWLSTGDTIDVTASAGPAGVLGLVGLRVYPISPVLP